MSAFKYRVRIASGEVQAGVIQAESMELAEEALQERGMTPILLEPYRGISSGGGSFTILHRVSSKEVVGISRALSVMVSASVPLTEALHNMARQAENPRLRFILLDIASEVEGGGRLSDAIERHVQVFGAFFVNMIRSGETSGQLSEVLEYLADQQEKDYDLRSKIRGAMIYPAFILGSMVIVGFVMMAFVVPKLLAVLREANVALPLPTRLLIAVSGFFASFWWLILIFAVAFGVAFRVFMTTPLGKYVIDLCLLRLPVFGRLFQGMYVVRFTRSLSTLVKGGVDTVGALAIVAEVVGNEVWKRMIQETIREVNDGNSLTTVFERSPFVPSMMNQMLAVGEHTGRTQEILQRVSTFYSREIDNVVANLVALIEPIVLLLLGGGVGILVSAILLPLYSLSTGV